MFYEGVEVIEGVEQKEIISEDEAKELARLHSVLADPARIRILSILKAYEGKICVTDIVKQFSISQPTVSHHIRFLLDAGLINQRKQRLIHYYSINKEALARAEKVIRSLITEE